MAASTSPRLSGLALLSLALALAAPLTLVTGPLAVYFGYRGLYAVNASEGRLRGRWLALFAMAVGAACTILGAVGVFALLVTRMRTDSARAECANNLRVIGVAVYLYADEHEKVFPPAVARHVELPPERRVSWMALILPYLERRPNAPNRWEQLAGRLDDAKAWDDEANQEPRRTHVPFFLCPGYPDYDPQKNPGLTTYVGLSGVGAGAARLPKDAPLAGFFGYERTLSREELPAAPQHATLRETSYKMMVVETTRQNGPWIAGGPPTLRDVGFEREPLDLQAATMLGLGAAPAGDPAPAALAAAFAPRPDEPPPIGPGRPFGGLHRGGMNVLWVDGSVRFVSETIRPHTFRLQAVLTNDEAKLAEVP